MLFPSYTLKTEGSSDGGLRSQQHAFCSTTAGALRTSRGPAGPMGPWAWCAPADASGRLPSLTVEVGPSRVPAVTRPLVPTLLFLMCRFLFSGPWRDSMRGFMISLRWVVGSMMECSGAFGVAGAGEISVSLSDTGAVAPAGAASPS